jgi:hypothetical protein
VVLSLILLPILLFLWAVGIGVTREFHPEYGYAWVALGLGALAVAARPAHRVLLAPPRVAEQH